MTKHQKIIKIIESMKSWDKTELLLWAQDEMEMKLKRSTEKEVDEEYESFLNYDYNTKEPKEDDAWNYGDEYINKDEYLEKMEKEDEVIEDDFEDERDF